MEPGCTCTSKFLNFSPRWARSKHSCESSCSGFPSERSHQQGQKMLHTGASNTWHLCSLKLTTQSLLKGPKQGLLSPPRTFPLDRGCRAVSLKGVPSHDASSRIQRSTKATPLMSPLHMARARARKPISK